MPNNFQIWLSSDNGNTWTFYKESDASFHAIRTAREESKGMTLKVINIELNFELIRYRDGLSIPTQTQSSDGNRRM